MPDGLTRLFADGASAQAFRTDVSAQLEGLRRDLEAG